VNGLDTCPRVGQIEGRERQRSCSRSSREDASSQLDERSRARRSMAFKSYAAIRHIKVEDGKGRRLGRSFSVKLWPTLIFINAGQEVERVVRPIDARQVAEGLAKIAPSEKLPLYASATPAVPWMSSVKVQISSR
jgi:hypothetical protein